MERAVGDPPFHDKPDSQAWQKYFSRISLAIPKTSSYDVSLTPSAVAANTKARQLFTVNGITVNDIIAVNAPPLTVGLDVVGSRVFAANTIELVFWNSTGAAIAPGTGNYLILATRK